MATTEDVKYFNKLLGNNFHKFSDDVLKSINNYINKVGGTDEINPNSMEFKIIRENNPFLLRNNTNADISKNVETFLNDAYLSRVSHLHPNCLISNKFFDANPTDFLYRLRVMEVLSNDFNKYFKGLDRDSTINDILKTDNGNSYKETGYAEKSTDEKTIWGKIETLSSTNGRDEENLSGRLEDFYEYIEGNEVSDVLAKTGMSTSTFLKGVINGDYEGLPSGTNSLKNIADEIATLYNGLSDDDKAKVKKKYKLQ